MESLYRTYRPLTFADVAGQQHIVSTLEHAILEGRLSHAYLFCGPRGTGKTTLARIVAKALLCQEAANKEMGQGVKPCGTCEVCKAIAAGIHPDVYELDAASRTGVDNVREEIVNSVAFAPIQGRYKVYIIDEVHMLTTAAFNALLKTLEEPPAHVVFILCTTDPQKIIETILSRCQRFDFHRIGIDDLVARMRFVCAQEGFVADEDALQIVARHAQGGMRDGLSVLEQLAVFGHGEIRAADAQTLLGDTPHEVLQTFASEIAYRDVAQLYALVRAQVDAGKDVRELTRDLIRYLRDIYTVCITEAGCELVEGTQEELHALQETAKLFGEPERVARCLMVLDDATLKMRDALDARLVLEIALTRLTLPQTDLSLEALVERLSLVEEKLVAAPRATTQMIPAAPIDSHTTRAQKDVPRTEDTSRTPLPCNSADLAASDPAIPSPPAHIAPFAPTTPAPSSQKQDRALAGELQRKWGTLIKRVTAVQASRGALLQSSRLRSDDGEELVVSLPVGSDFAVKMLERPDSKEIIAPVVYEVFGARHLRYVMEREQSSAVHQEEAPLKLVATSQPQKSIVSAHEETCATSDARSYECTDVALAETPAPADAVSTPLQPDRAPTSKHSDAHAILTSAFGAGVVITPTDAPEKRV